MFYPKIATSLSIKSRSKSADTSMRLSTSDIKKSIDRLSQPKTPVKENKDIMSRSVSMPPKATKPAPRPASAKPTPKPAPAKPAPTKQTQPPQKPPATRVVPKDVPFKPISAIPPTKGVTPTKVKYRIPR